MKNTNPITDRNFGGQLHLKLRRNRTGLGLKIRHLLRSFEPLNKPADTAEKK